MDILTQALVWVKWLGIGGIVAAVLLVMFAPAMARVLADFLGPIAKAIGEFVVWFFRDVLWEGARDVFDNMATIVFLCVAMLVGGWFLSAPTDCKPAVDKAIAKLRLDYKFVPRTPAEKKAIRKQTQTQTFPWFW